ncbi:MAG TPA: PEP/pyruvate-binding domain-containing protein [Candidatus Cybelea sp.]|nr:PEP/pyruvate-binding domain-containing protein [Candidatus Cybelea sp.]
MTDFAPRFIGIPSDSPQAGLLSAEAVGSKAAELSRMCRLGLRVPPAFVLPTALCIPVNRGDAEALRAMEQGLMAGIARLEQATGRGFGDGRMPLLVSVRSGGAQSMPGMLSTILDVGLNAATVQGLIGYTGNPRLAWDSYRRFIQIYAEVVHDAPAAPFEAALGRILRSEGAAYESDLDPEALERLTHEFHQIAARSLGIAIPEDPMEQLSAAARAVYRSWDSPRAREYRRLNRLEGLAGTAVTVQTMVFGNSGGRSGAGVAFSRNPATGAKEFYVDFLFDAQGEDVVSGRRMPGDVALLAARLPREAKALTEGAARLERELRDIQDIEFTIEDATLYFLQTRSAKRTPRAALRILVDLVREGLLDTGTALKRAQSIDVERARVTRFADDVQAVASAISASPGVASGRVAFDTTRARALAGSGDPVILVRHDTSTEDVAGFAASAGILTAVGGRTAHAAVVARQMGRVCLVGCRQLRILEDGQHAELGGHPVMEGDWISLDGATGEIALGQRKIVAELPEAELAEIDSWRGQALPATSVTAVQPSS